MRESLTFTYNQLKEDTLGGCIGNLHEIEFAICMLKNVNTLELIVFSPFHYTKEVGNRWKSMQNLLGFD